MQQYLIVDYTYDEYVTRKSDPNDPWDMDDTRRTNSVLGLTLTYEDGYNHVPSFSAEPIKVGDQAILLWAEYSTGCSFGSSDGQVEFLGVFTDLKEAARVEDILQKATGYSVDIVINDTKITFGLPWIGYFENLECINQDVLTVKGKDDE